MKKGMNLNEVAEYAVQASETERGWLIDGWFFVVFKDDEKYAAEEYIRDVSNWHSLDREIYSVGLPVVCIEHRMRDFDDAVKKIENGEKNLNSQHV